MQQKTHGGYRPQISRDGRFVAFISTSQTYTGGYHYQSFSYDCWANDLVAPRALYGTEVKQGSIGNLALSTGLRTVAGLPLTDRITLAFESMRHDIVPESEHHNGAVSTRTVTVP